VTPISASGAGSPSAEAGFSYNPSAPDGIELPGTIIGG
jgi:hypothetical protein